MEHVVYNIDYFTVPPLLLQMFIVKHLLIKLGVKAKIAVLTFYKGQKRQLEKLWKEMEDKFPQLKRLSKGLDQNQSLQIRTVSESQGEKWTVKYHAHTGYHTLPAMYLPIVLQVMSLTLSFCPLYALCLMVTMTRAWQTEGGSGNTLGLSQIPIRFVLGSHVPSLVS